MASRVYIVTDNHAPQNQPPRLVDATYEHSALRHVSHGRYSARIATKRELVQYMSAPFNLPVEYADPLRGETQQALALESAEELSATLKVVEMPHSI